MRLALTGLVACSAAVPVEPPPLLPYAAWELRPHGSAPRLTADGRTAVVFDFDDEGVPTLFVGPPEAPDRMAPLVPTGTLAWWDVVPDGSAVIAVSKRRKLRWLPLDGTPPRTLGWLPAEEPAWVEPRWADRAVLVAVPTDGGGLRVDRWSFDGVSTPVFEHGTADDVVLDSALAPRLLIERDRTRSGRGVDYDLVQVRGTDGTPYGAPVRQEQFVYDRRPFPRIGDGPVHLLAGDDVTTLGILDERGFTPVREPSWADATHLLFDPVDGTVDSVGTSAERLHWSPGDDDVADLLWLRDTLGTDVRVLQRTADDAHWTLETWSGSEPLRNHVFARETRTLWPLGRTYWAPPPPLRPVEALVLRARDGLPLAAYLTRPDPDRFGPGPHPLVVQVHGGPWYGRHGWTVDAETQQWAERGYATLAVNFRGTRGFGWKLVATSDLGDTMIDDVHDGISWAIEQGIADPARIAMVGASYGGYATLRFATEAEPRIRCGVAGLVYGNLTTEGSGLNVRAVKTPEWREAHSPDRFTANLRGPVLVWTGGKDGENPDSIRDFVDRARAAGKDVTWVKFPDEGHGLESPANRHALALIQDRFLAACLGGRAWAWEEPAAARFELLAGALP